MSAEKLLDATVWWIAQNFLATAIMVPIVALLCRLFRYRPAVQSMLWTIVLLKFILPPLPFMSWRLPDLESRFRPHAVVQTGAHNAAERVPAVDAAVTADELAAARAELAALSQNNAATIPAAWITNSLIGLGAIWITGALAVLWVQAVRIRRVYRIVCSGVPATAVLAETVDRVARQMRVRWLLTVVAPRISSPFLCCLGRIRLVWPSALAQCQGVQVRSIVAHEIAHVRRGDYWIARLEFGAALIWWWNPLFWFARNRLRSSIEMACDAMALAAFPEDRCHYAETLLWLSANLQSGAPLLAMAASGAAPSSLERRLRMIVSLKATDKLPALGIVAALLLGFASIPRLTIAQTAEGAANTGDRWRVIPDSPPAQIEEAVRRRDRAELDKQTAEREALEAQIRRLQDELALLRAKQAAANEVAAAEDAVVEQAMKAKIAVANSKPVIVRSRDGKDIEVLIERDGKQSTISGATIILRDGKVMGVQQGASVENKNASDSAAVRKAIDWLSRSKLDEANKVTPPPVVHSSSKTTKLDDVSEHRVVERYGDGSYSIEIIRQRDGKNPEAVARWKVNAEQKAILDDREAALRKTYVRADESRQKQELGIEGSLRAEEERNRALLAEREALANAERAKAQQAQADEQRRRAEVELEKLRADDLRRRAADDAAVPTRRRAAEEKPVDLVTLATSYADAIAAVEVAKDSDARQRAQRKAKVLNRIAEVEFAAATEELKRIEQLVKIGAAPIAMQKELQTRCAILQEILDMKPKASDGERAGSKSSTTNSGTQSTTAIANFFQGMSVGAVPRASAPSATGAEGDSVSAGGASGMQSSNVSTASQTFGSAAMMQAMTSAGTASMKPATTQTTRGTGSTTATMKAALDGMSQTDHLQGYRAGPTQSIVRGQQSGSSGAAVEADSGASITPKAETNKSSSDSRPASQGNVPR